MVYSHSPKTKTATVDRKECLWVQNQFDYSDPAVVPFKIVSPVDSTNHGTAKLF